MGTSEDQNQRMRHHSTPLTDAIPDHLLDTQGNEVLSLKDWVYAIETRQGSLSNSQEGKDCPGVHFVVATRYICEFAEDTLPLLKKYISIHALFREIFESYHDIEPSELEDYRPDPSDNGDFARMENELRSCCEAIADKADLLKAYQELSRPAHNLVVTLMQDLGLTKKNLR